jgi:tetratricopeptide (TPR) repeat protein
MLLYNRERRFDDALAVIRDLMARFPRNRILRLEAGATAIRGRQYSEADRLLTAGIEGLASDNRPRAFGEEAMWYYKRGLARLSLRRIDQARVDLDRALQQPAREWVRGRIRLEQGKLADLEGRRDDAKAAYIEAARLASAGNDPGVRREAEQLQRTPYK